MLRFSLDFFSFFFLKMSLDDYLLLLFFRSCFIFMLTMQVNVVRSFSDTEGPQWKHSLFGNPNDPETFRLVW